MKCISCRFAVVDGSVSDRDWAAYKCGNPKSEYQECEHHGRITPAMVVDHIVPHKSDLELFWDEENLQTLCKSCHDRKTAKEGRWGEKGKVYSY